MAEIIVLLVDGSSGRIIKSCFGQRVFRLRTPVSSCEAPGMLDKGSALKSPSKKRGRLQQILPSWPTTNGACRLRARIYLCSPLTNLIIGIHSDSRDRAFPSQGPDYRTPMGIDPRSNELSGIAPRVLKSSSRASQSSSLISAPYLADNNSLWVQLGATSILGARIVNSILS
jgi:hypothetical protein